MAGDLERWAAERQRYADRDHGFGLGLADIERGRYNPGMALDAPLDVLDGYDEAWRVCGPTAGDDHTGPDAWQREDDR